MSNNKIESPRYKSILPDEKIEIEVYANKPYSADKINVLKGEMYRIDCNPDQRWRDWYISSGPDGFFNVLASLVGLRVKGVKCLCLCACHNDQDEHAFAIGHTKVLRVGNEFDNTCLSFFANDSRGFYSNNSGVVKVFIERIL